MRGLNWQTINLPLAAGLANKYDDRALPAPKLEVCRNIVFDEIGGLQKRKPLSSVTDQILDSASTLTDIRRIVAHNDEMLCFTKRRLYSFSPSQNAWSDRGEYLAPKVEEKSVFVRSPEQFQCDRVELNGVTFYTWAEGTATNSTGYVAATDSTTGAVLLSPKPVGPGNAAVTVRMVKLDSVVVVFFGVEAGLSGFIEALVLDPTDLAGSSSNPATPLSTGYAGFLDVAQVDGATAGAAWSNTFGEYTVATVTDALVVTTVNKPRPSDGPIALSIDDAGNFVVTRIDVSSIESDYLDAALADSLVDLGVGTSTPTVNRLASLSIPGTTTTQVFWTGGETSGPVGFATSTNTIDSAGTVGSGSVLANRLGLAAKPFIREGEAFVWMVFAANSSALSDISGSAGFRAALQNTYFLYKADGTLIAKATPANAGGFSLLRGYLPTVQDLGNDKFAFCGTFRRQIPLSGRNRDYAARSPREICVTFDSDDARRTATLGRTLYITGGQVLQYDGAGLTEVGFHLYPWFLDAVPIASGNPNTIEDGVYTLKSTYSWENAQGELERSTTASTDTVDTNTASGRAFVTELAPLHVTLKQGDRSAPAIEVWRTAKNPVFEAPFYLTTSKNPSEDTGRNRYVANDPSAAFVSPSYEDELIDEHPTDPSLSLTRREVNPENGAVLESLAPPPASIVLAGQDRLFLAGIAGAPNQVWYSRLRSEGEVASFNDGLTVSLPESAGPIRGLAILNETLVAFCETSIFALSGFGFDNLGGGRNYGPPETISLDVGLTRAEALAVTPAGVIFFSRKGWFMLDRSFSVRYIGAAVSDFDDDDFVSVEVLPDQHQIRCVSTSRVLLFDYVVEEWSEWGVVGVDSVIFDGSWHVATVDSIESEDKEHGNPTRFGLELVTSWIKVADLQGFARIRRITLLGEYRSDHEMRVEVGRDYTLEWFDDKTKVIAPRTAGEPEQFRHNPSIQKMQAFRLRIRDFAPGGTPAQGESVKLTGLAIEVGFKRGQLKHLPATRKQ